jgi:hypothetical protein
MAFPTHLIHVDCLQPWYVRKHGPAAEQCQPPAGLASSSHAAPQLAGSSAPAAAPQLPHPETARLADLDQQIRKQLSRVVKRSSSKQNKHKKSKRHKRDRDSSCSPDSSSDSEASSEDPGRRGSKRSSSHKTHKHKRRHSKEGGSSKQKRREQELKAQLAAVLAGTAGESRLPAVPAGVLP